MATMYLTEFGLLFIIFFIVLILVIIHQLNKIFRKLQKIETVKRASELVEEKAEIIKKDFKIINILAKIMMGLMILEVIILLYLIYLNGYVHGRTELTRELLKKEIEVQTLKDYTKWLAFIDQML